MKSIANQYRDLKEGRMSQANFMRNLRMTMPQYVTNTTSFGDAVRILKNKSIIVESNAGNDQWLDAFQDALGFKTYMSPSYIISQYGDMKPEDAARKFMDDSTESAMAKDKEKSARETGLEEGDEELDTMVKKMEDGLAEEIDTNKVYGGTGQNQGDTGSSLQFTVIKDTPEYFEIDFTLTPNSRYRQAGAGSRSPREKEYGYVKVSKADFDGWIKAKGENFYIGKDFIANNLQSDNEFDAMIKAVEDERASEKAKMSQYDLGEELNEFGGQGDTPDNPKLQAAIKYLVQNRDKFLTQDYFSKHGIRILSSKSDKELYDYIVNDMHSDGVYDTVADMKSKMEEDQLNEGKGKDLHPNQINPAELRMGIKVELEHTDVLDKAKKIALDHLAENPYYYTALKLAGVESPSAPKVKQPEEKKAKKAKDAVELVDKANQMQKVKMPKADEKKKLKEARFNVIGEPNEVAKQVMQFIDGNATLKALSDDLEIQQTSDPNEALLRFQYWDALPGEAIEKLKLQFNVQPDNDFDEDTGEIIFYRLTPLRRNYGGKDLGASFEKFKSSLEEIVREVMAETFDGRDNLTNITDDTK
jgi:hypothetical protein